MEQPLQPSFESLLQAYIHDQLSPDQLMLLQHMLQDKHNQELLKRAIDQQLHQKSPSGLADPRRESILFENIMAATGPHPVALEKKPLRRHRRIFPTRLAIAASLLALVVIAGFYNSRKSAKPVPVSLAVHQKGHYHNDVAPGSQKATLTLANGTTIDLDDAKDGSLAKQGSATVIKINGRIGYQGKGNSNPETLYNTIATPKGGQYQVQLPDGTVAWLNAASSIHFPTTFNGAERRVTITGEAYFEIAKDRTKPFIVQTGSSEVKVLGTHFNVMAYSDEARVETTLLEGSVIFSNAGKSILLKPLESVRLDRNGQMDKTADVNADDILAWKNGLFHFENADIHTIMRQLSRWYDVDVEYRGKPGDDEYFMEMPRDSKLSSVLKVLELTGNIKLEIEGRKIIVD